MVPEKRIETAADMAQFARSPARARLLSAVEWMSRKVVGLEIPKEDSYASQNAAVRETYSLLTKFNKLLDETLPLEAPQRFGNPAFRAWLDKVSATQKTNNEELDYYLNNSFGSRQRIDYGTGHELNFVAFFDGFVNRECTGLDVLYIWNAYFALCRKFISKYQLEPAGSHGVWGLDDHFHIPYILGAAQMMQLSPDDHPQPRDLIDERSVREFAPTNLYFAAIAFILKVKKGPFFEHSPVLYSVTSVKTMSKIYSGMLKMYQGEVLNKLQVVQHFYFGTLFAFE